MTDERRPGYPVVATIGEGGEVHIAEHAGDWHAGRPVLCLGGPLHGQYHAVPHRGMFRLASTEPGTGRELVDSFEYVAHLLARDGMPIPVWALARLSTDEIVSLFNGRD